MSPEERERAEEKAHGGLASRDGLIVTLGDGAQWWLNGPGWTGTADALIVRDRERVAAMRVQMRG